MNFAHAARTLGALGALIALTVAPGLSEPPQPVTNLSVPSATAPPAVLIRSPQFEHSVASGDRLTLDGGRSFVQITSFSMGLETARDGSPTGLAGKRGHSPLEITKAVDPVTSPLFAKALSSRSAFPSMEIWIRSAHFKLTNVFVHSISVHPQGQHETESVKFVYSKIEWTWTDGGKTFSDEWSR